MKTTNALNAPQPSPSPKAGAGCVKRLVLRLACQALGHDWYGTADDHGYNECMRCDYCEPHEAYEPWTVHHWLYCRRWALRNWLRWKWQRLKCRFAKQDDDVPF